MKNYRNLKVWQKSHAIVLSVYHLSSSFPPHEIYTLTSQIRRSAISIPSNIAEGSGRKSDGDFSRFLTIAAGSTSELGYQLFLAHELKYVSPEIFENLNSEIEELSKMLNTFISKL